MFYCGLLNAENTNADMVNIIRRIAPSDDPFSIMVTGMVIAAVHLTVILVLGRLEYIKLRVCVTSQLHYAAR